MSDHSIIDKLLNNFIRNFNNLKKHNNITLERVKADLDLLWIIERGLFLCIQNILDIFAHIVAYDLNENWEYYSDISEILFKRNIISLEEKELLNKMISLRNRLSHEYISIEPQILVDIMNNRLDDFIKFVFVIRKYRGIV